MEISGSGSGSGSEAEQVPPGLLASMMIQEKSPEFLALKEEVRQNMQAKGGGKDMDDKWVTYMTHMRIIDAGLSVDQERVSKKIEREIEERRRGTPNGGETLPN